MLLEELENGCLGRWIGGAKAVVVMTCGITRDDLRDQRLYVSRLVNLTLPQLDARISILPTLNSSLICA